MLGISDSRRNTPAKHVRSDALQASKSQFGLNTSFGSKKLMPFIDHDRSKMLKGLKGLRIGQQQSKALRGNNHRGGRRLALAQFGRAGCISSPLLEGPRKIQTVDAFLECQAGVVCKCSQWGDPQGKQGRGRGLALALRPERLRERGFEPIAQGA